MANPGYTPGGERDWWWKVADHLDKAVIASVNAMVHNVDAQDQVFKFQDKLREAQTILLQIFQSKGLLPGSPPPNGANGHNGVAPEILVPEVVTGSNGVTSKEPIQDAEIVTADAPPTDAETIVEAPVVVEAPVPMSEPTSEPSAES